VVDADVSSDGVHPGRELGTALEIARPSDDTYEDILRQVFRHYWIPDRAEDEVEERTTVARQQLAERVRVAAEVSGQELLVARRCAPAAHAWGAFAAGVRSASSCP